MTSALLGRHAPRQLAVVSVICAGMLGLAGPAKAASPDPNLALARAETARLVGLVPLPAGTTSLQVDPFTSKPFAPPGPSGNWQVFAAGHWLAPIGALAMRSYLSSHPPPHSTQNGYSFTGGTLDWTEYLSFPTSGLALTSATLDISISPYGRSQTEVDAVATVLWKPTWEQIPAATRSLTVSVDRGPSVVVTGRARIAAFARAFARLSTVGPGAFSCPATDDPVTAVVTLDGAGGARLGTVTVSDYGCNEISVRLGGRRGASLWDDGLLDLLWRERGVLACRASQLTGTIKHAVPSGLPSIDIELKNTSKTECSVDGYPRLKLMSPGGQTIRLRLVRHFKRDPASLATARPGETLVITATWRGGRPHCTAQPIGSAAIGLPRVAGGMQASAIGAVSVCNRPLTISPVFNPGFIGGY